MPRYNWNIVESGVKYHNSNPAFLITGIQLLGYDLLQWAEPVSLTYHSALRKLYTKPSICASYQISVHLATQFQSRRFFRNRPPKTRIAYGGHVCKLIGIKLAIFIEGLPYMIPIKFQFIWQSGCIGED